MVVDFQGNIYNLHIYIYIYSTYYKPGFCMILQTDGAAPAGSRGFVRGHIFQEVLKAGLLSKRRMTCQVRNLYELHYQVTMFSQEDLIVFRVYDV